VSESGGKGRKVGKGRESERESERPREERVRDKHTKRSRERES